MLRATFLACALIVSAICAARPMVIHQTQSIDAPPGYYFFGYEVAIDGDWALVAAAEYSASPSKPQQRHDALLYHRVNGQWTLDRVLATRTATYPASTQFTTLAMNNGVAVIGSNPTQVLKRTGNSWAEIAHPFNAPPGDPDFVQGYAEWDGNTLLATRSACDYTSPGGWGARIATLNSDGTWSPLERLASGDAYCEFSPVMWGISGDTVVAGAWANDPGESIDKVHVFRRNGTTWSATSTINLGSGEADVRNDEIFVASPQLGGTLVYRNDDSQTVVDHLRTVQQSYLLSPGWNLVHSNTAFLQHDDVFQKDSAGKYQHVAKLLPQGVYSLVTPAINGQRVVVSSYRDYDSAHQSVLFFDLPTTYSPSPVISTGFTNGASPFQPQLGAFAVAKVSAGNYVYRQSDLSGDYRALLGGSDWVEQSIEADIRPTEFSGADRWAGLAVRYQDPANFYYVTLRSSGVIALKAMRNGVITTLQQKALPFVAGKRYRVALQASGTLIRANVDGRTVVYSTLDSEAIPHGNAALLGYKTAVEYDNVTAAQVGQVPIYELARGKRYGPLDLSPEWTSVGTNSWDFAQTTTGNVLRQTSTAGDARALVGTPTDDQVVSTRARLTSADGADRWFGITVRYVDSANYYYFTMRTSNTVSLRKVVNGAVVPLGTAKLTITPNTWYDLRLDAVGNEIRAFINGQQVFQVVDSSHAKGQGGALTYKAAAEYMNYYSWQP